MTREGRTWVRKSSRRVGWEVKAEVRMVEIVVVWAG